MPKKAQPKDRLEAWVKSNDSITKAAAALDCSVMTIRNILAGGTPSGRIAATIERETKKAGDPILAAAWWG